MKKIVKLSALILVCLMLLSSCYIDIGNVMDLISVNDYKEITNDIFTKYIEMNVTVITRHKGPIESYDSQGSGVIYKEDARYYYCITNAHVVESDPLYPMTTYAVTDCYGTEYLGAMIHSDPEYDLAVVKFHKGTEPLCVVELSDRDPMIGAEVAVLGTPNGLINSLTYGEILNYDAVKMYDEEGNDISLDFSVIWHDAPMWEGASGSVLLNTDMKLVGINFAVSTDENNYFIYGHAISVSKVREYLNKYNLL